MKFKLKLPEVLSNQQGIMPVIGLLLLLTVGILVGVAAIKNGTNFIPFADMMYPVTRPNPTQGYFLSAYPHFEVTTNTEDISYKKRSRNGSFYPGDKIAVYVKVASDLAESTSFQTSLSYPTDILEATKIITTGNTPTDRKPQKLCGTDKDCRASEFCDRVACIAMAGVQCPDTGYCTSREKLTCTDDASCGTGFHCEFSKNTDTKIGHCAVNRGTGQEGSSCKRTTDCASGLKCGTTSFNRNEATCQRDTGSKLRELQCDSDNDCGTGTTCQELRGPSICGDSYCTDDLAFQGTYCAPDKVFTRGTATEGQSCLVTKDCAANLKCFTQPNNGNNMKGICQATGEGQREIQCQDDGHCQNNYSCQVMRTSSCPTCDDMIFTGSLCAPKSVQEQAGNSTGGYTVDSPVTITNQVSKRKICSGLSDTSCGDEFSCYSDCSTTDSSQGAVTYSCYKTDTPPVCPSKNVLAAVAQPECKRTGCSGQICSDNTYITTCRWSAENSCYAGAICERQTDGKCGWTQTDALKQCLTNAHKSNIPEGDVCFNQGSCAPGLVCTPNKCNAPQEVCNRYEITSTCQKPDPQKCPKALTRACTYEKVMCIKGPCPPRQVCKNFESVCEVPAGWIVEPIDTKLPNPNEKDFFIKSWQKSEFSNQEGLVWLSGGMGNSDKRSGLKTTGDPDRPSMAIVVFTAKKGGKAEVKVTEAALKNSLGDGQFVEKGSVVLTVTDVDRMPTDIPPSTPAPVSKIRHLFNQVFGSGGGPDNQ